MAEGVEVDVVDGVRYDAAYRLRWFEAISRRIDQRVRRLEVKTLLTVPQRTDSGFHNSITISNQHTQ